MALRPYQKLVAWQEAYKLCLLIYKLTKKFPTDERFGLVSQMRRSSASVPCNISEGNSKKSEKEKAHFFETALCSLNELHCQCLLSKDLSFIDPKEFDTADDHIQRVSFLITKLLQSIR